MSGQAPPERGGGLLVGQRPVGCDGVREGDRVEPGAGGGGEPGGQVWPGRVAKDPGVDPGDARRPAGGRCVGVADRVVDPAVEVLLMASVGGGGLVGSGGPVVGVGDAKRGPPDGQVCHQVRVCVEQEAGPAWGRAGSPLPDGSMDLGGQVGDVSGPGAQVGAPVRVGGQGGGDGGEPGQRSGPAGVGGG